MKNLIYNKFHKYFSPYIIALFLVWTLILLLSFFWNYQIAGSNEEISRILLIHVFLWAAGIILFIPNSLTLFKQKRKIETLKLTTSNFETLFNSITSPAFIFNKQIGIITGVNNSAKEYFQIDIIDENNYEVERLNDLLEELKEQSDSTIQNILMEDCCASNNDEKIIFNAELNDISINNTNSTLIVLNKKAENDSELEEMSEYIEDLHAKEDALEDNAFEMIQLTIKLEESENNLREVNANKDKFFSIVAHDLKSPFVGLLGITEMLDTDYHDFDDTEKRELIRSLHDISKNTFELLEGLLEWARAKQGRMEYKPKEFNLFQIADSLAHLLKANTFKKNIVLHNSVDINSVVYGDRDMVATVVRNLLANAIKFTPQNGSITINAQIENNLMKVSVKDTGIGMSPANIEKLFRIDVSHTTLGTNDEKGTGLGLILCQELVEKHGTNIWVESELEKGSTFIFTLPLAPNIE